MKEIIMLVVFVVRRVVVIHHCLLFGFSLQLTPQDNARQPVSSLAAFV